MARIGTVLEQAEVACSDGGYRLVLDFTDGTRDRIPDTVFPFRCVEDVRTFAELNYRDNRFVPAEHPLRFTWWPMIQDAIKDKEKWERRSKGQRARYFSR